MNPITRTADKAHRKHDATGRKPAPPANDVEACAMAWPFRWLSDPREVVP